MDTIWAFREAYHTARSIRNKQDEYCTKALAGQWSGLGDFPESLQWEALVDVLRGRVKVLRLCMLSNFFALILRFQIHNHCYEAVDLDGIVRVSTPTLLQSNTLTDISIALTGVQIPNCSFSSCA